MHVKRFSVPTVLIAALICCSALPTTADEPFAIRTVMTNTIPELPEGMVRGFRAASINSQGRVAADADPINELYRYKRFIETDDGMSLVAQTGTLVPTRGGRMLPIDYLWGNGALISDDNRTAYACVPESYPSQCFVSHVLDGPAELLATNGSSAPGLPDGTTFSWFAPQDHYASGEYRFGRSGTFSFIASLHNVGTSEYWRSIWIGNETGLRCVAKTDDRAPGTEDGVVFTGSFSSYYSTVDYDYHYRSPTINGNNEVAFLASLSGSGVDSTNRVGVWMGRPDSLRLVARMGQHVCGMAENETIGSIYLNPAINNAGQTAFTGEVEDNDGDYYRDYAVFADVAGQIEVIMRESTPAPGTPKNVVFDDDVSDFTNPSMERTVILKTPLVDDSGLVAFMSYLRGEGVDGTNHVGLWTKSQDEPLQLLARMGDRAPGFEDESIVFDTLGFAPYWDTWEDQIGWQHPAPGFSLNGTGQVAFYATVRGDGINYTNDGGIWATDKNGELHLIVREGDPFEVAPGDVRTIRSLWISQGGGGSDGNARAFNERGELVFVACFTDSYESSGVFVATIPEPTTACLMLTLGICLTTRRRRRQA